MTDQKRLAEMMEKIRAIFPDWGFVLTVYDSNKKEFSGWSNMEFPKEVLKRFMEDSPWEDRIKSDIN